MRYMFLVYTHEGEMSPEETAEVMAGAPSGDGRDVATGILQGAEPLQPTMTATTVRHQSGKPLVTDGPFAETKEQLGGYYIIDCKDLDEAIEWGKKIPTKCRGGQGCIEIRPIRDISEFQKTLKESLSAQHA